MRGTLMIACVAILVAEPFGAGLVAYREGRFREALDAFVAAERDAGDGAPAELLYDRALAALRAGVLRDAEFSAEKAVARGGRRFVAFRDFLLGNTAFLRCQRAEAETSLIDPDPTAFERAVTHAVNARDAWLDAAERAGGWATATRNAERAQRKLEDLRERQAAAERERRSKEQPRPEEAPAEPDAQQPPDEVEARPEAQRDVDALTAEQLERLLQRLAENDARKRALRRQRSEAADLRAEQDW